MDYLPALLGQVTRHTRDAAVSLPSIKVSLPLIFVAWGVGAWLAGMWPLLLYPAIWAALAAALWAVNFAIGKPAPTNKAAQFGDNAT